MLTLSACLSIWRVQTGQPGGAGRLTTVRMMTATWDRRVLMSEVSHAGKDHGDAVFVTGRNDFRVIF
jgi:hypothetical protein